MIKISHEAPKSLFPLVQTLSDYDYFLVHLFEEDPEYLELYNRSKEQGREIILDNSIFELGTAFDPDKFRGWVEKLKPDWYIVPDVLEDCQNTMENMRSWNSNKNILESKKIGVLQGKTYGELRECYEFLLKEANVDMIAISFDYSYYEHSVPHSNKLVSWMLGRVKLLGDLLKDGVIDQTLPHHLLGNALPIEGKFYKDYKWIHSTDTSNPVVHGLMDMEYQANFGLYTKHSKKLFELINHEPINQDKICNNILEFRKYWLLDQL